MIQRSFESYLRTGIFRQLTSIAPKNYPECRVKVVSESLWLASAI
jgi:hypothetical protein